MQMIGTSNGTSTPGNTKAGVPRKARNYLVTSYEQAAYKQEMPKKPHISYLVECEDSTADGKWHMHAFIYFTNPVAMASLKKLFGNSCHVERPHFNSLAIQYVKGEIPGEGKSMNEVRKYNIKEFGEPPMDNGVSRTVAELKKMETPDELEWKQYHTYMQIHSRDKIKRTEWHKPELKVYYFYGNDSGVGKSKAIQDWLDEHNIEEFDLVKHVGDFWHIQGDGTGVAVYDEFRDSHMPVSEFINFIDYNIHSLNIKGGSLKNKYHTILISSIQNPHRIYRNQPEETRRQWLRRINIIEIGKPVSIDVISESDSEN